MGPDSQSKGPRPAGIIDRGYAAFMAAKGYVLGIRTKIS